MIIDKPTYLIAELGGDVEPLVLEMRKRFNPGHLLWPVDITIIGSSGIGTIKEGQGLNYVIDKMMPVLEMYKFSDLAFFEVSCFPNTGIYHLVPEKDAFKTLHSNIGKCGVEFNSNPWPYNPHCTLRSGPEPSEELNKLFNSLSVPSNSYIKFFSLYQPKKNGGLRVHQF